MPKRPIGSSQGGKGPMKKYRRVAAKRMNYVPLRWIAKQNRPFRATIPINPFPPVYRTKVTWAPPATTWTLAQATLIIQFKLNSVFDCELSSVFSATQQPLFLIPSAPQLDLISNLRSLGGEEKFIWLIWVVKVMIHQVPHYVISMRYCISKDMSCLRKGDTNAELQAAPNLQRHLLPGIDYLGDPAVIVYGSLGVRSRL